MAAKSLGWQSAQEAIKTDG